MSTPESQEFGQTSIACEIMGHKTGKFLPSKLYRTLEGIDKAQPKMYLVNEEGKNTKMTEAEAKELGKAEWKNTVVFPWRQGDILVIDNLQVVHGRLNVQPPRKILTAFGNMCNICDMKKK